MIPAHYPRLIALSLIATLITPALAQSPENTPQTPKWKNLLDPTLSQWEIWMGVPHSSSTNLPAGTETSENVHRGTPMGLNNDPQKVFTVIQQNGEHLLKITGQTYGCISSLEKYSNYHLQMKMKWGQKKWPPRLQKKRDSGILYHAHGNHGAFWKAWKQCLEFQVQEKDMGDFIPLAGPSAMIPIKQEEKILRYDPSAPTPTKITSYVSCQLEPDLPNGQWNTLDLYVIGDSAIHVVNGVVVLKLNKATTKKGKPLTSGQLQIQSEAAECYYKQIRIRSISAFPPELTKK